MEGKKSPVPLRRRKVDKWGTLLKAKQEAASKLMHKVAQLEAEQAFLKAKEQLMLRVMQGLRNIAGLERLHGRVVTSTRDSVPKLTPRESSSALADAVQDGLRREAIEEAEQQIQELLGSLRNVFPSLAAQLQDIDQEVSPSKVLTRSIIKQVLSKSSAEIGARLQQLAGMCGIAAVQGRANDAAVTEYMGLGLGTMLCNPPVFREIYGLNLETLQPMVEPLPASHWVEAVGVAQLSQQQMDTLKCMDDMVRTRFASLMQGMRDAQREAMTAAAEQEVLLQQAAAGAAPGPQAPPLHSVQCSLTDRQDGLLKQWVILGLHMGIVILNMLSMVQHTKFIAASFPSQPRVDLVLAALRESSSAGAWQGA